MDATFPLFLFYYILFCSEIAMHELSAPSRQLQYILIVNMMTTLHIKTHKDTPNEIEDIIKGISLGRL